MTTEILDLDPLRAAPLVTEPFPFVTVQNVIRPERITELARDFPALSGRGLFPAEVLPLGPAMQRLVDEIRGDDLREAIEQKFGLDLTHCPPMITLRGHSTERDGRTRKGTCGSCARATISRARSSRFPRSPDRC